MPYRSVLGVSVLETREAGLSFVIQFLTTVTFTFSARPFPAIFRFDVIALGTFRVVVVNVLLD